MEEEVNFLPHFPWHLSALSKWLVNDGAPRVVRGGAPRAFWPHIDVKATHLAVEPVQIYDEKSPRVSRGGSSTTINNFLYRIGLKKK